MREKSDWRNLILFFIGQGISSMGTLVQKYCISLYILNETGSSSYFAILMVLSTIPSVVLGPIGGVFADRISKRKMMICLDFLSTAVLVFSIFIIGVSGNESKMLIACAAVIVLSIINAVYIPSANSAIPLLASKDELVKANSMNTFIITITNILAPIFAGVLCAKFDIMIIMLFNGISFFVAAIIEIIMKIDEEELKNKKNKANPLVDFKEGLTSIRMNEVVKSIIICSCVCNFIIMPIYSVGIPYIVKVVCGFSDIQYGWIESSIMIGMIVGAVSVGMFVHKIKLRYILGGAISSIGIGMLSLAALLIFIDNNKLGSATKAFAAFIVICILVGCVISVMSISLTTLLQKSVKKEVYARISAIVISLSMAAIPLGQAVLGGFLGIVYSPVILFALSGVLFLMGTYYMRQRKLDS